MRDYDNSSGSQSFLLKSIRFESLTQLSGILPNFKNSIDKLSLSYAEILKVLNPHSSNVTLKEIPLPVQLVSLTNFVIRCTTYRYTKHYNRGFLFHYIERYQNSLF